MENFASKKVHRYSEPEVSLDYFLYSCLETEKMKKTQRSEIKHSAVIESLVGQSLQLDELFDGLLDTVSFYKAQYPEFGADGPITMTTLNDILSPFVDMQRDFRVLIENYGKEHEVSFLRDQLSLSPMWQTVERVISSAFPRNHDLFLKFLFWSFAEKGPEEDEVGNRPPIGRFSPYTPRGPRFGGPGQGGGGRRGGGSGGRFSNDRGGNRDRPPQRGRGGRNDRPEGKMRADSNRKPNRERNNERFDRGRGENNGPRPPRDRDPRIEEESIAAVVKAAKHLRDNPDVAEFRLPATNSYYRLLQHQQVKREGFYSRSEGEGQDRALVVVRTGVDNDNEGNA